MDYQLSPEQAALLETPEDDVERFLAERLFSQRDVGQKRDRRAAPVDLVARGPDSFLRGLVR